MQAKFEHASANAKAWYESIKEQLEALHGYDKAAKDAGWTPFQDKFDVLCWKDESDGATFAGTAQQLCEDQGLDVEQDEDVRTEIEESPLSVQVRGGWHQPGICRESTNQYGDDKPEEFEILLTTGGPAMRIRGQLNEYCQPTDCELQMQDWGTPWTKWTPEPCDETFHHTLLAYASCFYFGD